MKKTLLLSVILSSFSTLCFAQYRINKEIYDTCKYSYEAGDPFNPAVMAFSSALIPGLGQIIEGETGRGLGFLGGFLSLFVTRRLTLMAPHTSINYTQNDIIRWATITGNTVLRVWSAFDAAHVAKINDLAFRAKYGIVIIKVIPYPDLPEHIRPDKSNPVGITLLVSF